MILEFLLFVLVSIFIPFFINPKYLLSPPEQGEEMEYYDKNIVITKGNTLVLLGLNVAGLFTTVLTHQLNSLTTLLAWSLGILIVAAFLELLSRTRRFFGFIQQQLIKIWMLSIILIFFYQE